MGKRWKPEANDRHRCATGGRRDDRIEWVSKRKRLQLWKRERDHFSSQQRPPGIWSSWVRHRSREFLGLGRCDVMVVHGFAENFQQVPCASASGCTSWKTVTTRTERGKLVRPPALPVSWCFLHLARVEARRGLQRRQGSRWSEDAGRQGRRWEARIQCSRERKRRRKSLERSSGSGKCSLRRNAGLLFQSLAGLQCIQCARADALAARALSNIQQ